MRRLLIVPAAGAGSRLGLRVPKALVPVAGVPMIDRLLTLYRDVVDRVVVVVGPSFAGEMGRHLASRGESHCECVVQAVSTGMLDAIVLAAPAVERTQPAGVWITWCDQVAV